MFARVNMFEITKKAINDSMEAIRLERYTVPGVKDLPVAAKRLFDEYKCDIVIALGMPGDKAIDKVCAHEASQGLIQAQLMTNKHIIEVFVHIDEGKDEKELYDVTRNRTYDHTMNAIALLKGKETLSRFAGKGVRQGKENVGGIE
jgi:riboflavin synthase